MTSAHAILIRDALVGHACPADLLPVIAITDSGVRVLGNAGDHATAGLMGDVAGISHGRISRAELTATGQRFFALRP